MSFARKIAGALAFLALATGAVAQNYTPTQYQVTLYTVEISTTGTQWTTVLEDNAGMAIDLADPSSFANAFGSASTINAGTYDWIRMTISEDLVWSHPAPPVSLSNQTFTVSGGPPGPGPGLMTVYFATHDEGGLPNGQGGGAGTQAQPFLLGSGAEILPNVATTLRLVFVITDALEDQGGSVYDLQPPQMYFVAENTDASDLAGTFNTVLYNAIKEVDGMTVEDWRYESGHGTLTFDGAGNWTWSGTANEFDLQGGPAGALDSSAARSGLYGVKSDGSFWMIADGAPGTLRGAISSDGTMILATMYDSASQHVMFFGVEQASAASVSSLNGNYYFTTYGSDFNVGTTTLTYRGAFGVVTGNGTGSVTGNEDSNSVDVVDPTGSPSSSGPSSSLASPFSDTLSIGASGTITNGTELAGGVLESGDAACIAFNFDSGTYRPANQFGFLVRQSATNTFSVASLNGSYFGGHFGDVYNGSDNSTYFSGFFKLVFNGEGNATVTLFENREGTINVEEFAVTYAVNGTTGIVTFSEPGGGNADIKGAIGPGAMSFILTSEPELSGTPNDQRFLGLGLKQ